MQLRHSCLNRQLQRHLVQSIESSKHCYSSLSADAHSSPSSDTAQTATTDSTSSLLTFNPPRHRSRRDQSYQTSAGVILCRSPIITRELNEFEKAFYTYQRHLKSRLSSPFPTDFYFTKGSLASKRWQAGEDERRRKTDLFQTSTTTTPESEPTTEVRELEAEEDVAAQVALSRTTEADRKGDTKSLDRKLDKTLYLLLKKDRNRHSWQFPQGALGAGEVLHDSTDRILESLAGKNMRTWQVSRVPIGHLQYPFPEPRQGYAGNKVYFLRYRIFAGQCQVSPGYDFGWFTADEVMERVDERYFKQVKGMLGSR